jgi:hypothetical protein
MRALIADYRIDCDSSKYRTMAGYCAAMVLCYPIGVPLVTLLVLARAQGRIYPRNDGRFLKVRGCTYTAAYLFEIHDLWRPQP